MILKWKINVEMFSTCIYSSINAYTARLKAVIGPIDYLSINWDSGYTGWNMPAGF